MTACSRLAALHVSITPRPATGISILSVIAALLVAGLIPRGSSADLKLLVGSIAGSVKAYDGSSGAPLGTFTSGGPNPSASASALAIGGPPDRLFVAPCHTGQINEYDAQTGAFIRILVPSGVDACLSGIAFGADGFLYAGDESGGISHWDSASGSPRGVFVAPGSGGLDVGRGIRFGPDGNFYLGSYDPAIEKSQVLRYDGITGSFLDVFVSEGSGGLQGLTDLAFGPDGDLYVSGGNADNVLRYDGLTGAFVGVFASGGGLDVPFGLAFGPDHHLYVSNYPNNVLRFDGTTGAFIDVFASSTDWRPAFIQFTFVRHDPSSIIEVDATADDLVTNGNCTLREAIRAANLDAPVDYCAAGSGFDFISIPAGTYHLTRGGAQEDDGVTGDLDLRSGIALQGAGSDLTVIDATGLGDRVLHIRPPDEGPDIQVEIRDLRVQGGAAGLTNGGGIEIVASPNHGEPGFHPSAIIERCVIQANTAFEGGGVSLRSSGGTTTISRTAIRWNTAGHSAGFFSHGANVSLLDSTVEGNVADEGTGGIGIYGSMAIRRSTIADNRGNGAGGIVAVADALISIGNSTISGNTSSWSAGGIVAGQGTTMIEFTTISGNRGMHGGGIFVPPSSNPLLLLGTIVAGNDASFFPDVEGAFTSRGHNLIGDGDGSTGFGELGDQVGTSDNAIDPRLAPLADNGGLTKTQALTEGSPARDAADCLGITDDQRREPRPAGGTCDIGAFELPEPGLTSMLGAGAALLGLLRQRRIYSAFAATVAS